jgi:hypothetical protein
MINTTFYTGRIITGVEDPFAKEIMPQVPAVGEGVWLDVEPYCFVVVGVFWTSYEARVRVRACTEEEMEG